MRLCQFAEVCKVETGRELRKRIVHMLRLSLLSSAASEKEMYPLFSFFFVGFGFENSDGYISFNTLTEFSLSLVPINFSSSFHTPSNKFVKS